MSGILVEQSYTRLCHIADSTNSTLFQQAWKSALDLHLPAHWQQVCDVFTDALTQAHIRITEGEDEIVWAHAKNGRYLPKDGYLNLMEAQKPEHLEPWWKALWKLKVAPRTRVLMWSILFNKVPTGLNLMKRSFHGPFRCHLCRCNEESTEHLFLECPIISEQWNLIQAQYPSLQGWRRGNLREAWLSWLGGHNGKDRNLPLLMCWAFWTARN